MGDIKGKIRGSDRGKIQEEKWRERDKREKIEGEKPDVRDMGHIDTGRDIEWWRDKRVRRRKDERVGEKGKEKGGQSGERQIRRQGGRDSREDT